SLDVWSVPPVARIRFQHDLDARRVAHELVRAGADRILAKSLVADFFQVFLGHDDAGGGGRRAVEGHEVGPRLLQLEADRERVGASVTCHAMTASPGWAAPAGFAARASRTAVRSEATRPFMGASPGSARVFVVVLERDVDERLPATDLLAHRPRERPHPEHHA